MKFANECWMEVENPTAYHDGKWLAIVADCEQVLDDIETLLAVKRKLKHA